jgi:uncharacterized membrane protein YeiH
MFETAAGTLDCLGVTVFTVTGALVAARKEMHLVGFAVVGTAAGIGGGTIRDLLLGLPVFWSREPAYLLACLLVSALMYFAANVPHFRFRCFLWADAFGLALFAVTGAERARQVGASAVVAAFVGVVTATFGGIIRDLLGGEKPVLLSREFYVLAALSGATAFIALTALGASRELAIGLGFLAGFTVRAAALRFG